MFDFKDKVVLITGGAIGIGEKVVELLIQEEVKHVAVLDVLETEGLALQRKVNDEHGKNKVRFIKCDVSNEDELEAAYKTVYTEQGYIDVVINNAGIMNESISTFKKEIEINVTAVINSTLKAIELMRKDKGGKGGIVINVSSIAALTTSYMLPIYHATKSAVMQFTICIGLPENFLRTEVKVMALSFGVTDTALISKEKYNLLEFEQKEELEQLFSVLYAQRPESAARGVIEACKRGESGSSWFSAKDKPVVDITETTKKSYGALNEMK